VHHYLPCIIGRKVSDRGDQFISFLPTSNGGFLCRADFGDNVTNIEMSNLEKRSRQAGFASITQQKRVDKKKKRSTDVVVF